MIGSKIVLVRYKSAVLGSTSHKWVTNQQFIRIFMKEFSPERKTLLPTCFSVRFLSDFCGGTFTAQVYEIK
jgi:hypothetical protein